MNSKTFKSGIKESNHFNHLHMFLSQVWISTVSSEQRHLLKVMTNTLKQLMNLHSSNFNMLHQFSCCTPLIVLSVNDTSPLTACQALFCKQHMLDLTDAKRKSKRAKCGKSAKCRQSGQPQKYNNASISLISKQLCGPSC